jgi:hypothetical protein
MRITRTYLTLYPRSSIIQAHPPIHIIPFPKEPSPSQLDHTVHNQSIPPYKNPHLRSLTMAAPCTSVGDWIPSCRTRWAMGPSSSRPPNFNGAAEKSTDDDLAVGEEEGPVAECPAGFVEKGACSGLVMWCSVCPCVPASVERSRAQTTAMSSSLRSTVALAPRADSTWGGGRVMMMRMVVVVMRS